MPETFTPNPNEVIAYYREKLSNLEHELAYTIAVAKQLQAERDSLREQVELLEKKVAGLTQPQFQVTEWDPLGQGLPRPENWPNGHAVP